jgi:hypothetical protein
MSSFSLKLAKNNQVGFCNQLYSTIGTCIYAYENKIKTIYLSQFLKEIGSNDYCNVSEIYDLPKTNEFLKKYDLTLIDGYLVNETKIISVLYGTDMYSLDITDNISQKMVVRSTDNLNLYKGDPRQHFKQTLGIDLQGPLKVRINYMSNKTFSTKACDVVEGKPVTDLNINNNNRDYEITRRFNNDDSPMFRDILRNFVFHETIVAKAEKYIDTSIIKYYIDAKKTINVFHLRLEDDAIKAWGKEVGMTDLQQYKRVLEDKYINIIKGFVDKDSLTIFLASDYDNRVIRYMRDNGYNYATTPKFEKARDVSAIVDMHIGSVCTGICVGVWESSYSYTLFDRVKNKNGVRFIILYYTNLQHDGSFLDRGT